MNREIVLIVDFGGQNNQLIGRRVRECNVYCEVVPFTTALDKIKEYNPKGIVFSGNYTDDSTSSIASGFEQLGLPVMKTNTENTDAIKSFLFDTCKCLGEWKMSLFAQETIAELREKIGNKKVLCAMSGGVDSAVCAVLIHKAVGKQLTCVFVDHGLMRKNEPDEIEQIFKNEYDMNLIMLDCENRFLTALSGVTDPETKRKIIGEEFIRVFEEQAKKIGAVDYLVQGTIYPDIIESGVDGKGTIKSHHNVGGLPDIIDFEEIIEPVKSLFKDEVRKLALELGMPKEIAMRQPFPGPGLGVRVIGELTKDKLDLLRDADAIFREEIANNNLDTTLNQYFAVLTGMKSVGVTDEKRTYDNTIALRAVLTKDFMTAEWAKIPYDVLETVSSKIIKEVKNVNRVVYDITSKPPSTIEWE